VRKPGLAALRRFLRDERGTGVIELAVILPLLAIFVINVIDISTVVVQRMTMQKAVNSSLEMVMANNLRINPETGEPDMAFLQNEAARLAGVAPNYVTTKNWLECDGEEQEDFDGECGPGEVIARYVQVGVSDWYFPMFSVSAIGIKGDQMPLYVEGAMRIQ
jgi:Flp pilus assembly pilin Flp